MNSPWKLVPDRRRIWATWLRKAPALVRSGRSSCSLSAEPCLCSLLPSSGPPALSSSASEDQPAPSECCRLGLFRAACTASPSPCEAQVWPADVQDTGAAACARCLCAGASAQQPGHRRADWRGSHSKRQQPACTRQHTCPGVSAESRTIWDCGAPGSSGWYSCKRCSTPDSVPAHWVPFESDTRHLRRSPAVCGCCWSPVGTSR